MQSLSPKLCIIAIQQDWSTLRFVHEQTPELCKLAVEQNEKASKFFSGSGECCAL